MLPIQSQQPVYPQINQPPFIVLQNLPNHSHQIIPQQPQTITQTQSHRQ